LRVFNRRLKQKKKKINFAGGEKLFPFLFPHSKKKVFVSYEKQFLNMESFSSSQKLPKNNFNFIFVQDVNVKEAKKKLWRSFILTCFSE
jgi:hypothetical protein